jgi:hypothetical protein
MNNQNGKTSQTLPSPSSENSSLDQSVRNIKVVCDLYDLAVAIKSLELKRKNPDATEEWLLREALILIERGCR